MPNPPAGHNIQVVPDWVCEILSPATKSKGREVKRPLYARQKVAYAWLVDPLAHRLEAFELLNERGTVIGSFRDDDGVAVAPFAEIAISLVDLWGQ
jgi:Uma2 family endonuclease